MEGHTASSGVDDLGSCPCYSRTPYSNRPRTPRTLTPPFNSPYFTLFAILTTPLIALHLFCSFFSGVSI